MSSFWLSETVEFKVSILSLLVLISIQRFRNEIQIYQIQQLIFIHFLQTRQLSETKSPFFTFLFSFYHFLQITFQIYAYQCLQKIYIQMTQTNPLIEKAFKLLGISLASLLCNHLISKTFTQNQSNLDKIRGQIQSEKQKIITTQKKLPPPQQKSKNKKWGSLHIIEESKEDDQLIKELKQMDMLLFSIQRINNLIVDLGLENPQTIKCPLVNYGIKKYKEEPYLSPSSLVKPGQFIVAQCVYRPGMILDLQKKFLRAGPRATQLFNPDNVKADIVCLGKVCPGMNTVVRELVLTLKNVYGIPKVYGIKYSFRGYYENKMDQLEPKMVQTAHHRGGCFLGLSNSQFNAVKIVDSLIERQINQVYLIGANQTLKACQGIYEQILKRKLPIVICVILKGINRDVPIFDTCFGFETAVEESCRILQHANLTAKSHHNGVSLIKLPGYKSGFLACFASQSVINVNICLVPQFEFDLYGKDGLLQQIIKIVKYRGSCTIVYAQGAKNSVRDCCVFEQQRFKKSSQALSSFDNFFISQIQESLKKQKLTPQINFFNGIELTKSAPANSIDTKLCCQNAQASIQGLMCGYTNFASGHLANRNGMISVDELILSQSVTQLKETDGEWQRLLALTGQPSFLNIDQV